MNRAPDWLTIRRGEAPLLVSLPHAGAVLPDAIAPRLASSWLARKDADWWIDRVYDFASDLGATVVRTAICRTMIDVNRDPSGASLYPGQATTGLCPLETFDGEPLYRQGAAPSESEIAGRLARWFDPYHAALQTEIARLRARRAKVVVYDCHAIRSFIPRLFDGELPHFNIGTNSGASCDAALAQAVEAACAETPFSRIVNGRFKGGFITRDHGRPRDGVHAIQMELAFRAYLDEPIGPVSPANWPPRYDLERAAAARAALRRILDACLTFATHHV